MNQKNETQNPQAAQVIPPNYPYPWYPPAYEAEKEVNLLEYLSSF